MLQQSSDLDLLASRAMCCVPLLGAPLSVKTAEPYPDNLGQGVGLTSLRTLA